MKKQDMDRKQRAPSTWFLEPNKAKAAKLLVEWNDEGILCNWPRATRAYLYGSAFEGFTLTNLRAFGSDVSLGLLPADAAEDVPIYVNRVRSMAKAFTAKTGANDSPVPQFVTNSGDFEQRQAAENMDGVVCSEYEQQQGAYADFHSLCRKLELMVTAALGRGWVFVFPGNYGGRVKPEAEIDDGLTINVVREYQFGRVLTLSRSTLRDPESLIAKYPKKRKEILANVDVCEARVASGAAKAFPDMSSSVTPTERLVREIQGWHVSTGKNDPGRELFCLKDGTPLEDNEWDRPSPPCRHIDYDEELSASGGTPMTHSIYRLFSREQELVHDASQLELNSPLEVFKVQKNTGDGASARKQLEGAKGIEVVEMDDPNQLQSMDLKGLPRKTMDLLGIVSRAQHDVTGISQGHTDATQPKNVSSGIQASLEASLFPEVHADFVLRWNRFVAVDCAELFVWAIQDIVASKELYSVWAGDRDIKRMIKADGLDLDMSKYRIQVKPASARKDSVSTRLQKAERWLEDPTITFTGSDMAQFWKTYDVDHYADLLTGVIEGVERQIRKWRSLPLEQAQLEYRSPAKWMTIQGLEAAQLAVVADYEDARDSKVPGDRLQLWETYMNQCVSLIRTLKMEEAKIQAAALGKPTGASNGPGPGAAIPAPGGGAPVVN